MWGLVGLLGQGWEFSIQIRTWLRTHTPVLKKSQHIDLLQRPKNVKELGFSLPQSREKGGEEIEEEGRRENGD